MDLSKLWLISWQQNALCIWLTFYRLPQCAFASPGHQEATGLRALRESQRERKRQQERHTLTDLKPRLFPWFLFMATAANSAGSPLWLLTGLSVYRLLHREIRVGVRGEMITWDQGICCWPAQAKWIFRRWQAPGGLTDRLVEFMFGYLFIWIHSGL